MRITDIDAAGDAVPKTDDFGFVLQLFGHLVKKTTGQRLIAGRGQVHAIGADQSFPFGASVGDDPGKVGKGDVLLLCEGPKRLIVAVDLPIGSFLAIDFPFVACEQGLFKDGVDCA